MRYKFNPTGAMSVDWYVGKRCNFDCSYCVEYLHDNHSPHVPYENMKKLADYVYARSGRNVFWSLTGGEPTLNPDFIRLCQYLKELKSRHISLTTNGSRTAKYFLELFQHLDNITLSLHMESMAHRSREYIEKIVEIEEYRKRWNAEEEKKGEWRWNEGHQPKQFLIRFMVYPGQIDKIKSMEQELRDRGVEKIEFRYIRPLSGTANEQMPSKKLDLSQNHDVVNDISLLHKIGHEISKRITWDVLKMKKQKKRRLPTKEETKEIPKQTLSSSDKDLVHQIKKREDQWYSADEKKQIDQIFQKEEKKRLKLYFVEDEKIVTEDYHYNKLNFERKSNFEGWYCWAGSKHMKITPTGDIYVGSCHVGGKRGNIYEIENGIDLPDQPIKCPKWRCTDNLDLRVPKIKSMQYYDLIRDLVER